MPPASHFFQPPRRANVEQANYFASDEIAKASGRFVCITSLFFLNRVLCALLGQKDNVPTSNGYLAAAVVYLVADLVPAHLTQATEKESSEVNTDDAKYDASGLYRF